MSITVILIVAAVGLIVLFTLKLIQSITNLKYLNHDSDLDITKKREGMVYNKESQRLEADHSIILPFE
ncbi:MAG: hypothetical protein LIP09_11060 [Bacteroidales bacterium]|nr:hypothetical protein [Bacteroidales bacterium]